MPLSPLPSFSRVHGGVKNGRFSGQNQVTMAGPPRDRLDILPRIVFWGENCDNVIILAIAEEKTKHALGRREFYAS